MYINGGTTLWYGSSTVPTYGNDPFLFQGLSESAPNIVLGEAGTYQLSFYSDSKDMHVQKIN